MSCQYRGCNGLRALVSRKGNRLLCHSPASCPLAPMIYYSLGSFFPLCAILSPSCPSSSSCLHYITRLLPNSWSLCSPPDDFAIAVSSSDYEHALTPAFTTPRYEPDYCNNPGPYWTGIGFRWNAVDRKLGRGCMSSFSFLDASLLAKVRRPLRNLGFMFTDDNSPIAEIQGIRVVIDYRRSLLLIPLHLALVSTMSIAVIQRLVLTHFVNIWLKGFSSLVRTHPINVTTLHYPTSTLHQRLIYMYLQYHLLSIYQCKLFLDNYSS